METKAGLRAQVVDLIQATKTGDLRRVLRGSRLAGYAQDLAQKLGDVKLLGDVE